MAGNEDQQRALGPVSEEAEHLKGQRLLPRMGGGGEEQGTVLHLCAQLGEGVGISRQRVAGELQVQPAVVPRAEPRQAGGRLRVLGHDQIEAADQGARRPGRQPPAAEARGRQAAGDQGGAGAPPAGAEDQVRPQLALGEHGEVGAPVLQEAGAGAGAVHGDELMARAGGEAAAQQLGGGPGA